MPANWGEPVWSLTVRWDDTRKCFWILASHLARGTRSEPVIVRRLENDQSSPVDSLEMIRLLDAMQREYASWLW